MDWAAVEFVGRERVNPSKRIASLFRELAQAFDDLEAAAVKKPRARANRESLKRASEDAAQRVRDGLRRKGIQVS
jgi:hypothetical protein